MAFHGRRPNGGMKVDWQLKEVKLKVEVLKEMIVQYWKTTHDNGSNVSRNQNIVLQLKYFHRRE